VFELLIPHLAGDDMVRECHRERIVKALVLECLAPDRRDCAVFVPQLASGRLQSVAMTLRSRRLHLVPRPSYKQKPAAQACGRVLSATIDYNECTP
jgi:hypothetical protein